MKKNIKFLCAFVMMFVLLPFVHVHDASCGYDVEKGTGCVYEISLFSQDKDDGC